MTYLPGVLAEIASVAGEEAALAVADHRGGSTIWLPAEAEDAQWLIDAVGLDKARAICEHLRVTDAEGRTHGYRLVIPLGPAGVMRRARRRLAEALRSGMRPEEAARHAGLHERTAYRMQKLLHERRNSTQRELF